MSNPYSLLRPCAKCPFRNDIPAYLREDRVREIQESLERSEFPCHQTTEHDAEGDPVIRGQESHYAGALILLEKLEQPSQMMRIAQRLGMYDPSKLDMSAPVFDDFDEMAEAQPEERRSARPGRTGRRRKTT